jgi:small subunit ribosomal protein S6
MIISPSVADEDVSATIDKTSQFITERGGSIAEVNQWGRKKLAYPIKSFMEGNYVLTKLSMGPKLADELEASLRISEDILRHLLVRLDD